MRYQLGVIYSNAVPRYAAKGLDYSVCIGERTFLTRRGGVWMTLRVNKGTCFESRENDLSIADVAKRWKVSVKQACDKVRSYLPSVVRPKGSKGIPRFRSNYYYEDGVDAWYELWLRSQVSTGRYRERHGFIDSSEEMECVFYHLDRQEECKGNAFVSSPFTEREAG